MRDRLPQCARCAEPPARPVGFSATMGCGIGCTCLHVGLACASASAAARPSVPSCSSNGAADASGSSSTALSAAPSSATTCQRSPGADVAGVGPVLVQMWQGVRPVPVQTWTGVSPVLAQMWTGGGPVGDHRRRCWWWDDEGGEQPRGHGVGACSEPNSAVGACAVARRRARSAPERRLDAV
jgi:hypothetical protein